MSFDAFAPSVLSATVAAVFFSFAKPHARLAPIRRLSITS
jgi:hypothetical protein